MKSTSWSISDDDKKEQLKTPSLVFLDSDEPQMSTGRGPQVGSGRVGSGGKFEKLILFAGKFIRYSNPDLLDKTKIPTMKHSFKNCISCH